MLIKVKVFPDSKKEEIIEKSKDNFKIRVKEKPIEGRANKRVKEMLSDYFRLPGSEVRLIRGSKQRNKIFEVKNF